MTRGTQHFIGKAHGKIILIGEHAVVYGEPAIALPFKAAPVEVSIEKDTGPVSVSSDYYTGPLEDAPGKLENIKVLLFEIGKELGQTINNLFIKITSHIPPERGMGSSAAVSTALIRALFQYFNVQLNEEQLLAYIDISEKIVHGNPSGIDARVTSSDAPIFYKKNQFFEPFPINISGYLIVADTGKKGQTSHAVADVATLFNDDYEPTAKLIQNIGERAIRAKLAIIHNDLAALGTLLSQTHELLKELTVSDESLDHLVDTALKAGALGAKLTGGGRGGCMIALAQSEIDAMVIKNKLIEQGAINTWVHALEGE